MVTLNLTDTQAVMLHALFDAHLPEEAINMIKKKFEVYYADGIWDYATYAYAYAASFFENNSFHLPFEDDYTILSEKIWDNLEGVGLRHAAEGRKFLENNPKETNK